jgi:hypothetical protein
VQRSVPDLPPSQQHTLREGLPRPDDLWAASGFFTLEATPAPVLQRTFRSLAQVVLPTR